MSSCGASSKVKVTLERLPSPFSGSGSAESERTDCRNGIMPDGMTLAGVQNDTGSPPGCSSPGCGRSPNC